MLDAIKSPARDADQSALNILAPRVIVVTPPGPDILMQTDRNYGRHARYLTSTMQRRSKRRTRRMNLLDRALRNSCRVSRSYVLSLRRWHRGFLVPKGGRVILSFYVERRACAACTEGQIKMSPTKAILDIDVMTLLSKDSATRSKSFRVIWRSSPASERLGALIDSSDDLLCRHNRKRFGVLICKRGISRSALSAHCPAAR